MRCTIPLCLLVAACATDALTPLAVPPVPPVPPTAAQVRSVTVVPAEAFLAPGDSVQLSAVVDADSGVPREVVWRSANPLIVAVSATGVATAPRCGPDALTQVEALAVADTTKRGHTSTGRYPSTAVFPTIDLLQDSITGRDLPVLEVRGTVRVGIRHPRRGCPLEVDSLRLAVHGPGLDTTLRAAGVAGALDGPLILYWPTAAQQAGVPVFPNGQYSLTAQAVRAGRGAPIAGGAIPLRLTNP